MIRIKRITDLERFVETIPKPKGAIPMFGLPGWKMMPLDHKIPMVPGPKSAYNFTRNKLGKRLWGPRVEFDLNDPYCHETDFSYESLHDKHLAEFFSRQFNREHLLKADLITDTMDVKCSLSDYNKYRKYLRQIHVDHIKRELKKRDCLFVERNALSFAEQQARKEIARLKEREKYACERQRRMQERLEQKELRFEKLKEQTFKIAHRLKVLKLIKQEERRLLNIKREERIEHIREKCKIADEITRHKIITTLADWKKKDRMRKKAKEKQLLDIEQQKQKKIEETWRRKQQFQERNIAKQKILLQRADIRRQKLIKVYNNKIARETERMKKLLENAKLFTNCYIKRHLPNGRIIICCKKYRKDNLDIRKNKIKNNLQNSVNFSSKFSKQKKQNTSHNNKVKLNQVVTYC